MSAADEALVAQVCNAAKELDELITNNLALLDLSVVEYFIRASAHFRVLYLAYENRLGDDSVPFENYVYPKSFDSIINLQVTRLVDRKAQLKSQFSSFHAPLEDLEHFSFEWNREGFPRIGKSDSRCGLVKEASPNGDISFD